MSFSDPDIAIPANPQYLVTPLKGHYLIESSGDLLRVKRNVRNNHSLTCGFKLLKYNQIASKWVKVKNLNNQILFLGDNSSFSVSALNFPGYKPNCIYFTSDTYGYKRLGAW
ncbi:hypothetical protein GIB67_040069 [Kingdonia uniflora]|uniref:KIB1-4 beta-propeller domain-containing protein n=1 Tax=Kingdonia uniflora TaxID=39325 RepID=A0A7J7MUH2_9MAGN|nr:hypothetical protein GIB67_040069 [Kingdonia uniflora]